MGKIVQYHSSIVGSDAIGNSIIELDKYFRGVGLQSYVSCRDEQLQIANNYAIPARSILGSSMGRSFLPDDFLLIHYSFYDEYAEALAQLPLRKIIVYHNITPGMYFRRSGIEWLADLCDQGRSQLSRLAPRFDAAVGDSQYNCDELRDAGYKCVSKIPVLMTVEELRKRPLDENFIVAAKEDFEVNVLFVGRFVPNKCIDLVISTIAAFKRAFSLTIRLHIVGKVWDNDYYSYLIAHASRQGVASSVQFYHGASSDMLHSLFILSDAFVCMSDHEGFMVPIVEAFSLGCPVIAYNSSAIGETMGGAGILIDEPDPEFAASIIYLLKTDRDLKRRVVIGQRKRAAAFETKYSGRMWLEKLKGF